MQIIHGLNLYLGIALLADGQWSEAIDVTEKALQLSNTKATYGLPTNSYSWAQNIMGYAYQLQGNSDAAIAQYQNALELDKTFASAKNNLQDLI
ncbi:MAG: tetratricopeptide repeat protein [Cyanobacteria bacterium J06648_1]